MTRPALLALLLLACAPRPAIEPEPPAAAPLDVDRIFVLGEWRREQMIREAVPLAREEGGTLILWLKPEAYCWPDWPGEWPSPDGPGRVGILVSATDSSHIAGPFMLIERGRLMPYYRPLYWPRSGQ